MRGEYSQIWLAQLSPAVANEQGGLRPVVVISGEDFNIMPIRHAIVVAVTTRDRGLAHHVQMNGDTGLKRPSWAMAETPRAVSTTRFAKRIGWAAPDTMQSLADWLDFFTTQ